MKEKMIKLIEALILPKYGKGINRYKVTDTWYGLRVSMGVDFVHTAGIESEIKSLYKMLGPEEGNRIEVDFY